MKRALLTLLIASSVVAAQAATYQYTVSFSGPNEFPVNASPGIGSGTVNYDDVNHLLQLQATFSGLLGNVTQSHIHGPTTAPGFQNAGIAVTSPSLPGFPLGVTSGSYSNTLDLTLTGSYNATFLSNNGGTPASAEAAFFTAMNQGRTYWNIHSSSFGGGEVRGFLTLVPEPSSVALAALGVAGLAFRQWRRRGGMLR